MSDNATDVEDEGSGAGDEGALAVALCVLVFFAMISLYILKKRLYKSSKTRKGDSFSNLDRPKSSQPVMHTEMGSRPPWQVCLYEIDELPHSKNGSVVQTEALL
ncbi:hypothetical protein DIPPA_30246 [Diplonema papillatum]|nr:hypothetical protein DIPPA_30246 [Diplonema papillatum]